MVGGGIKRSVLGEGKLLDELILDPCRSLHKLGDVIGKSKSATWNQKKKIEDNGAVFGYTAIVDETNFGWQLYIALIDGKLQKKDTVQKIVDDLTKDSRRVEPPRIRSISTYVTMGDYDIIFVFAAKSPMDAKKFVDRLRTKYQDSVDGRPKLIDITFVLRREGLVNPRIMEFKERMGVKK